MGVKSLWTLLTPVGRPVMLETIEGKAMAIDSSIWIYQFQATMRDKDGRALTNAHVLGFLRRISKLLFYGIKPVFVFDGGAPTLKRSTIRERRNKKSGAAETHAKVAEKLLAAQMRREALNHGRARASGSKNAASGSELLDDAVYLEDIDGSAPRTPAKKQVQPKSSDPPGVSPGKARFHDHDPYRLPEVDLRETVAKATRSSAPDPRLATEDELRAFIEDMRPEDFDVNSPAFRELPAEVQYEIVGDLRLKSRQTSYKRLQNMLKNAHTPLDFSRQQIMNLKQRNALTQQLLTSTDSIGKAHITIPVRIASERNREYVLMKNEGESGGWILGIRDDGTMSKPIELDQDPPLITEEDESDMEMEEVNIPTDTMPDPDLRHYRQELALAAIAKRSSPGKPPRSATTSKHRISKQPPLFASDDDDEMPALDVQSDEDEGLAFAIQASLDQQMKNSNATAAPPSPFPHATSSGNLTSKGIEMPYLHRESDTSRKQVDIDQDLYVSPARLETALAFANVSSSPRRNIPRHASSPSQQASTSKLPDQPLLRTFATPSVPSLSRGVAELSKNSYLTESHGSTSASMQSLFVHQESLVGVIPSEPDSEDDMEEVLPIRSSQPLQTPDHSTFSQRSTLSGPAAFVSVNESVYEPSRSMPSSKPPSLDAETADASETRPALDLLQTDRSSVSLARSLSLEPATADVNELHPPEVTENWDAAQEMDSSAEHGEFARFMSQVKGRDLDEVRREIDEEIKTLHKQKKVAMRDSEDITQQMIAQIMIMLRLFGIPYITAPMEAEAQCAELVSLGLVDGIITDDSDVFLFGGARVFKNMFNQSKTVECFLLSDLERELGLQRDALIRLAYLLGSDYVEGLPGIGPVLAMELLREFPGEDGLHKFKEWWLTVQTGKDRDADSRSSFRSRFKKQFKHLYLPADWPNGAVRDAYYHPTVDSSEEPFKWGLPDLDGLRGFLHEELGWNQGKVDDLLLPIIQKMGKRGQAAALNKQGTLSGFFDSTAGGGEYAPRKRQVYNSKRLQQVVSEFRREQSKRKGSPASSVPASASGTGSEDDAAEGPAQKRTKTAATRKGSSSSKKGGAARSRTSVKRKSTRVSMSDGDDDYEDGADVDLRRMEGSPPPLKVALRSRPKPAYAANG